MDVDKLKKEIERLNQFLEMVQKQMKGMNTSQPA